MFVEPMYAKSTSRESLSDTSLKGWGNYYLDVKQDGMRAIVVKRNNELNIYSRTGHLQNGKVPQLEAELMKKLPNNSVIDGELALLGKRVEVAGQTIPTVEFNKTMRIMGSLPETARAKQEELGDEVSLIVFDTLEWDGVDHTLDVQEERTSLTLNTWAEYRNDPSSKIWVSNIYDEPEKFLEIYDKLVESKIEGAIMKSHNGLYSPGKRPNKTWYKAKYDRHFDVIVSGYTEGNGKYEGQVGAVKFSTYDDSGELVYIGKCSGLTNEERQDITDHRDEYLGRVFVVKSNDLVGSGEFKTPRHPNFLHWRFDKTPEQCLRDQFRAENV